MDQRPGHYPTPLSDAPLQGPQLPLGELAGVVPLKSFHQEFGRRIGILLEPQEDLWPDREVDPTV